ncbi:MULTISPECIES: YciE/YciF ferroxidase family protein [Haloprofundus]|uniref:YciE/YciF ferroxidase family protein n=1 Tax=Haloprofundus TaxID=1911573 RepID=UPI000E433D2C|nr:MULTISPECIES: DUF892 family protein [Haloprofundus]QCJ46713.1 DUF892 family protein [Haloprofundus sp. MHR1]
MATETQSLQTLRDLFEYELGAMYYVENRLVDTLDELAMQTPNENISRGFADHRDETRKQVERLERVFDAIDRDPFEHEVHALDGMLQDKQSFDEMVGEDELRNVHYLGAGMKTERFEITSYESLQMLADRLDMGSDVTDPLEQNLDEEQRTLDELQTMATGSKLKELFQKLTG